jgi:hypothetical protein
VGWLFRSRGGVGLTPVSMLPVNVVFKVVDGGTFMGGPEGECIVRLGILSLGGRVTMVVVGCKGIGGVGVADVEEEACGERWGLLPVATVVSRGWRVGLGGDDTWGAAPP